MSSTRSALSPVAEIGLLVGGIAAAALLAWLCVGINLERSCTTQDTPYVDLCPGLPHGSKAQLDALRARIASNPGDANAYVQLLVADRSAASARLLDAATQVAPTEPNVLMSRAAAALDRQDWAKAVVPLVQLVEYRDMPQAAQVLARLIAGGQGQLLAPYLTRESRWLARALAQMSQGPSSFSTALPLVVEALKIGNLEPDSVRMYIRQLKSAGAWADAYGLWLALHGKALPALYNSGFDDSFQPDGFDWEVTASGPASRSGAIVERRGAEARGATLDIQFTGRALVNPLVRQPLFLGEGRYRVRGDYMARQLRMEQGLAWTVRCTAAPLQAGRSDALGDTGGAWKAFAFEFSIPRGCGLVANLQLETFAPFEAALGARGRAAFDAFSLEKLSP